MAYPTRRRTLKVLGGAAAVLAAGRWPGWARGDDAGQGEDFCFLQVNDLHVIDQHCMDYQAGVVRQMKETPQAELCLIVGDLSDAGHASALAGVRDVYQGLGVPIYTVIGNHDWVTDFECKHYGEIFPNAINYTFAHRGWQFVALDSTQGRMWDMMSVQKHTLQWLEENVPKLDKKRPLVLFTHFPMSAKMHLHPQNCDQVLSYFAQHNLRAVFNGHYHGYQADERGAFAITTDSCCALRRNNVDGTKAKGYFVCQAKEGKITRGFVEYQP